MLKYVNYLNEKYVIKKCEIVPLLILNMFIKNC